jgi:hypothetical protein
MRQHSNDSVTLQRECEVRHDVIGNLSDFAKQWLNAGKGLGRGPEREG